MDPTTCRLALTAIADELERTRAGVDSLAALVSSYVGACPPAERAGVMMEAQSVDSLSQHLEAMAGFARALGAGGSVASAAAATPLAELADRLRAACGGQPAAPPSAPSDELELFD